MNADPTADTRPCLPPGQQIVEGWEHGRAFALLVDEVECGKFMRADLVAQAKAALAAARAVGLYVSISSAWRSNEEQIKLRAMFEAGTGNPADKPGWSNHQNGTALDLAFGSGKEREEFVALSIAHGFTRPTLEAWHFLVSPLAKESLEDV